MIIFSPEESITAEAFDTATQTLFNDQTQPVFNPKSGPASPLFKNKYGLDASYGLTYPKDLANSNRGHAVFFQIYEISPIGSGEADKVVDRILSGGTDSTTPDNYNYTNEADRASDRATAENAKKFGNAINELKNTVTNTFGDNSGNSKGFSINPRTKQNSIATIALYMPETLNFNYESSYNSLTSIAGAAASIPGLSKLGPTAINSFMENSAAKLAMSAAGYVFNPQQQVLFEGITFREYEMNFTFTPSSSDETESVKEIIKTFRKHAAPEIGGIGGFFFIPPSVFEVKFRYNGKNNEYLNLLKRSVLKTVNVNYAPNGWAAFQGSAAPVQITMALQFQEIVLVDKNAIQEGY